MNSDMVIITQGISEAVQFLTPQQIARAYAALKRCPDPPSPKMPDYETAWIRDGCVFLTVKKERDSSRSADFLAANGFELTGEEDGFLLYSSHPNDDNDAWCTWEAAWAFLGRRLINY